jgi:hypothetical protein
LADNATPDFGESALRERRSEGGFGFATPRRGPSTKEGMANLPPADWYPDLAGGGLTSDDVFAELVAFLDLVEQTLRAR